MSAKLRQLLYLYLHKQEVHRAVICSTKWEIVGRRPWLDDLIIIRPHSIGIFHTSQLSPNTLNIAHPLRDHQGSSSVA